MTAMNVLVTDDRVWIAQDHAVYRTDSLPTQDTTAADYALRPELLAESEKIAVFPDNGLLVGSVGNVLYAHAWLETVETMGYGIDTLTEIAPEVLRGLLRDHPVPTAELRVVHAGYSPKHGKVIGVLHDWEHDFEPTTLPAGSILHQPQLDGDAPGADQLNALGARAEHGENVEALFEAMFANQKWQGDNRRLRAGVLLSDDYTLASVDADGARLVQGVEAAAVA